MPRSFLPLLSQGIPLYSIGISLCSRGVIFRSLCAMSDDGLTSIPLALHARCGSMRFEHDGPQCKRGPRADLRCWPAPFVPHWPFRLVIHAAHPATRWHRGVLLLGLL